MKYVFFMFHICRKCIASVAIDPNTTVAEIGAFVSKEASTLLKRISVSAANTARHVGGSQSFDCIAPVNCLATDKYAGM